MYGEYGYIEEGKLGKPYNFRLLKRLSHYAVPYTKPIFAALILTILITLFDLAIPYLTKIAIDRYILASWYRIDLTKLTGEAAKDLTDKYGEALIKSRDGTQYFISHLKLKALDPADLHAYRDRQILTSTRFYRIEPHTQPDIGADREMGPTHEMADGSILIVYSRLHNFPKKDILKIRSGDIRGVTRVALVFIFLLLLTFGLSYAEYYLLEFTGQHIMQDIRLKLFQRMQGQAVRFFDRHPVGRLVTRATNDIENLNEMFRSVFITVFKDVFLLTGILAILLYLNWRLAMLSFLLLPFIFGLTFIFSTLAREAFRELRTTVAKINAFLQERITGMRIIQLFVREKFQMDTFARINRENYLAGMKQIRVFAVFMPIMELFSAFAVALILWHGGGKVIQEQLTLGALVAFISYIQMFFKPIRDISEKYNIMQSAMASTERIFEFMDHDAEIPEPEISQTPPKVSGHLAFQDVSFGYEKNRPVLSHISFAVKPGETVAIVGATGSGKTTLVNLMERFYDPDAGAVLLDGVDLRKWPKQLLHENISLVMQDVFIFAGNLAENISLGREFSDENALRRAAEKANALAFIERLPGGFQQDIGEGGGTLSAGERQLLSFARALAANPRVLILDEATSSVDPETEGLIQEAVSRIAVNRTTLVVAHRLSTIRNADRILVMHHGRIVEQGRHDALMKRGGIYYKLNKLREAE
ncbi:MAG: ABC transporter ATP-binding protein [Desulfatiglandaceae bacterium]